MSAAEKVLKGIRAYEGLELLTDEQIFAVKQFCEGQMNLSRQRIAAKIGELAHRAEAFEEVVAVLKRWQAKPTNIEESEPTQLELALTQLLAAALAPKDTESTGEV